jgi:hypothetical protein
VDCAVAAVVVAVDEASAVGTIEGASAASMMTVLVLVEVRQERGVDVRIADNILCAEFTFCCFTRFTWQLGG